MKRLLSVIVAILMLLVFTMSLMAAPRDSIIQRAQSRLKEMGYNPGSIDGLWGNTTEAAIKKFQQDRGLSVTGKLDQVTKEALGIVDKSPTSPRVDERIVRLKGDTIGLGSGQKSNPVVIIATSKQALYEMMRYVASGDVNSFFGVVKNGYGTLVPAGTQVQILGYDSIGESSVVQVKMLEGELSGRTVWTHSFFVP